MSKGGHGFAQPHDPRTGEKPARLISAREEEALTLAVRDLYGAAADARDHIACDDVDVPNDGVIEQLDQAIRRIEALGWIEE